jgi:hypothetical protein
MKVGLNVGERLMTLSVLPKEGSFVTLKVIRTLVSRLAMTSEEIQNFEMVEKDGKVHFNAKGTEPMEFEFDPAELEIIRKSLTKLDREQKLDIEMFTVYEKFCS